MLPELLRQRAHAGRYRQITTVLVQHGLGGLLDPIGVRLRRRGVAFDESVADGLTPPVRGSNRAVHLRRALEQLGPTFIKLGQILSTRSDLLPSEYIAELVKLQDRVPSAPFNEIRAVVESELGSPLETLFATFSEQALAAASIGQVHAATLHDGREVVVKVQRPGVQETIAEDLAILADIARGAEKRVAIAKRLDLEGLVAEFAWNLRGELDYMREGRNAERFARMFSDDPLVRIPGIHWSLSTPLVLTMDRLNGMRIDDQEAVASAGLLPKEIAKRAASILLREIFEEGFFHADPHPGNFLVTETGVVCAMDFGMVGALSERLREQLLFLLFAVVEQDTTRVVDDLLLLGAVAVETTRDSLERDVEHLIAQYYGRPLEEIQIGRLISEIMALVRRNQLRMPAELMMLAKTIVMSEAIGRRLDPSFQVTEFAEPFVRDALRRFYRPGYWKTKLKMKPLEAMMLATSLPGQTQRLLTRVERNQLTFHVHYDELDQTIRALNGMVNRLALAVLIASMGIGLVVLYGASDSPLKTWVATLFVLGFAVTALLGAGLVVAIWRNSRD